MNATAVMIALLAIILVVALVVLNRRAHELGEELSQLRSEVKDLRVTSRTRVSTMRAGARDDGEIRELRRLGRASTGRRVVVGGDDDSELNQALIRGSQRGQG